LYESKTEREIKKFKKYYKHDERLCTFKEKRLDDYYVFFAVKTDVKKIKRKNFQKPERQDQYGTSVISIQFSKGKTNTLSIKNRYNHKVYNSDCTFANNLDNIIPGLSKSFEREYNLNLEKRKCELKIPGYIKASDGRMYKYNYKINDIYYCPDNLIITNKKVIRDYQEKEKYLILDYFILDLVNKEIKLYDEKNQDSFIDGIKNIEKITILKSKKTENKTIIIICKNNKIIIELDKTNKIIGYENQNTEIIENNFLRNNECLEYINLPKARKIGNWFLMRNKQLTEIIFPSIEETGNFFLTYNEKIKTFIAPRLKKAGDSFLTSNKELRELTLENLTELGERALYCNINIKIINMSNLEKIGCLFLNDNNPNLIEIYLQKLKHKRKEELIKQIEKNKYDIVKKQMEQMKQLKGIKKYTLSLVRN